jgi:hypothetical protein
MTELNAQDGEPDPLASGTAPVVSRKEQYEALFRFYAEENDRYEALNKRGSAYLAVVGALSVFAVFKLEAISQKVLSSTPTLMLGLLTGGAVLACIVFVTLSLRIRDYSTIVNARDLVKDVDNESYGVEDMYTILLAGLVIAIEKNRQANDERADQLVIAVWFAVAAIFLSVLTNVVIFTLVT